MYNFYKWEKGRGDEKKKKVDENGSSDVRQPSKGQEKLNESS